MLRYLVVAALALVALSDPALAKSAGRARCPGGRFMAADAPLVTGDTAPEAGAVVITTNQVTVGGSCAATGVTAKRIHGGGTLVRARWASCSGLVGPVRLRATIRPGCATVVGVLRAHHRRRHFVATRQPECGNGIREGQEPCDGDECCTADCAPSTDPSCPGDHACTTDADCTTDSAAGAFCARPPGHCDGNGVCQSTGVICTDNVDPVCGCDGKTYSNACAAAQHGVSVATPGACGAQVCGTIAGLSCGDGQVCELPAGECHAADEAGRCVDRPVACLGILDPVCGCDGNTYVNDCYRLQAGVQKAHDRRCQCHDLMCSPGAKPVDTDGDGCPDHCVAHCDDACDCLHDGDRLFPRPCPIACTTTDSACGAFWACEDHACVEKCGTIPPDVCEPPHCTSNDDCPDGEYCAARPGQCGGPGVCAPRTIVCPEVFAPVCGCDGTTYGSACDAAGHGARVLHEGPCKCAPPPCAAIFKAIDTDGDGCLDTCVLPCHQTCDCYKAPGAGFAGECPLDCASCGEFFTCEEGACREHCGPIPPNNDQCQVPGFCTTNDDCTPGEYCACGLGMCDGPGICVPRPDVCTREVAPVCGCDGQTYSSACLAAAAGARVAAAGPCEVCHDVTCPDGTQGTDTDGDGCIDTCRRPCHATCDCGPSPVANTGAGICPLAALCPAPLCGSFWSCVDGFCEAECGLVPPRNRQTCPVDGSCTVRGDCGDGQTCRKDTCGSPGTCVPAFACTEQYDPVCGCDGKTYGNACAAQAAGAGVAARGACDPSTCTSAFGGCSGGGHPK